MAKTKFVAIRNQFETSTLELFFLDVIQDTFDWMTGMTHSQVQEIIDKVNAAQPRVIKVIIDSQGGDAQAGLSIYNFLKHTDARVEVEVIGLAGSIASVIAMAANPGKLRIARNGFMMIHKAEGLAFGTGEELRSAANVVDLYTGQIVDIYAQRTGKAIDEVNALIAPGDYWMTGQQAVDQGFADATFNDVPLSVQQIAARLDTSIYKNSPPDIKAALERLTPGNEIQNFLTNQFDTMKEQILKILNAIRGVKPATENGPITGDQIATAMQPGFDELATVIDNEVTTRVTAALAGQAPPVMPDVAAEVTTQLTAAKITDQVTTAVTAAIEPYKVKIAALEGEIVNLKGKQGNSGHEGGEGEGFAPKGKFNKG